MQTEQKDTTTTHATNSVSEEPVPSVDVPQLEHTFKLLTNWNLGLLIVAGVIALTIGVLSVAIDRKGSQLLDAKDAQLAVTIATVKGDAAKESTRIEGETKTRIAAVEADSNQKIAAANRRSEEISAESNRKAAELRAQNLTTEQQLEKERDARQALEEDITPRLLEQGDSSKALSVFKETTVAIKTVSGPDFETRRMAGQMRVLCEMAGWKIDNTLADLSRVSEMESETGITLEANIAQPDGSDHSSETARVIEQQLAKSNIAANSFPRGLPSTMPPLPGNTIIIHVGLKPVGSYFSEKRLKELKGGIKIIGNY